MAAPQTVPQFPKSLNSVSENSNSITLRRGVVTLFGYGISVRVDRGHLILEDGIGETRRYARFARVRHGLKRLVVIGAEGIVSLAALRWIADQDAAFIMLDRQGSVLATTGPVASSDARLRRAQSLASQTDVALCISRELILQKLSAQERVALNRLNNSVAADKISKALIGVSEAESIQNARLYESHGAGAYWSAWRTVSITYPTKDIARIPDHWRTFGARISPLTGSPRLAVNPPNAMLNYLYALLESEASIALAALGLDPGIGVMHVDGPTRRSLACDLMEPVRPKVDAFVLDWLSREPLQRNWFFEERNGSCRLMGPFAARLSETSAVWRSDLAPLAEWIARTLWNSVRKPYQKVSATRLTQTTRREARGRGLNQRDRPMPHPVAVCRMCGVEIKSRDKYCVSCAVVVSRKNLIEAAKSGRLATVSKKSQALRSATQSRQVAALKAWNPSDKPDWLDEITYRERILPRLKSVTVPTILKSLSVSEPYAANIRAGRYIPHARHWLTLAQLTAVTAAD